MQCFESFCACIWNFSESFRRSCCSFWFTTFCRGSFMSRFRLSGWPFWHFRFGFRQNFRTSFAERWNQFRNTKEKPDSRLDWPKASCSFMSWCRKHSCLNFPLPSTLRRASSKRRPCWWSSAWWTSSTLVSRSSRQTISNIQAEFFGSTDLFSCCISSLTIRCL